MNNPNSQFNRTELMFGQAAMTKLAAAKVAIFGIGGVGGYVVEALARSGVGSLDIFDGDAVEISNLNRQIIATHHTLGRDKVKVAKERILSINKAAMVGAYKLFYLPDTADTVDLGIYDYVIDAIDTIAGKVELTYRATQLSIPIISAMGAANKLDATKLLVADIYETSVCPLAKVMRHELRKRGIEKLKVVYSTEAVFESKGLPEIEAISETKSPRPVLGSNAFVPAAMGLIIAGEVVREMVRI